MKVKAGYILSFLTLAIAILTGCHRVDNVVWSKYAPLPSEGWDPINVIPFFPWPEDSVTHDNDRYSLILSIRFSPLSSPGPLHLAVHQDSEYSSQLSDTIHIEIDAPSERPTGRGAYGIFEKADTLATGIKLQPGYCVQLQSLSAPENTKGIRDIGLILALEGENESSIFPAKLFSGDFNLFNHK